MANFSFALRLALGMIPKTEKVENQYNQLVEEYYKLLEYRQSAELNEYKELESFVGSSEFKKTKSSLLALNYQSSDDFQKEKRYLSLKKSKPIVNYFQVLNSAEYKRYNDITASDALARFHELDQYLQSDKHKKAKAEIELAYNQEIQKKTDYLKQKKSSGVKSFLKTKNSTLLANYNQMINSQELADFEELTALIKSEEFLQKKQDPDFKNSEEANKEIRLKQLTKDKRIVNYLKFSQSDALRQYNEFAASKEWSAFQELEAYVLSAEYNQHIESLKYTNSDEYKLEKEYTELKNSADIKFWGKFHQSKQFLLFNETESSTTLTDYQSLDELVNSESFKQNKSYLLDKNKFEKTDEFQKEKRLNELKNSANIKWFLATDNSNKFDSLKAWHITFEDDFSQPKLDDTKWMNSFFWGKMLINDRYVIAGDKQFYTDNKNIEIGQSVLKIITKKEKANGKVWHPAHGFSQQDFEYTSGMISTAHSFRQLYGRFEAKIKINPNFPVYQAFWLKGEQIVPQIDVFKFNMEKPGQMKLSVFNQNGDNKQNPAKSGSKLGANALSKDFFIYSVDWTPEKITWKINGIEAYSTTQPIPNEPMYLMLSAGVQKNTTDQSLPAAFEIDWIRCFEKAEN